MRNIYTCVDIGSDSIRYATMEYYNGKFNVLASTIVPSMGVRKGKIYDANLVCNALKKGFKNIENTLGTKIEQAIAIIPSDNMEFDIVSSEIENDSENKRISGNLIFSCMQDALKGHVDKEQEVVGVFPIEYILDNNRKVSNALGLESSSLKIKAIVSKVPYKNVYTVVNAIKNVGVEVVDVLPSEVANYYAFKNKDTDSKVVSLIDIGCEKTNVSVFNKGIIVKNAIIPIGSNNIDLDISNSYNLPIETAKDIKEIFAVGNRKYADSEEYYDCLDKHKASVRINQYQLAEIIEMRTIDILKNAKIETNNLTKREIGYIMVTGGISSILGFTTTIEDLYPKNASSMNINIIGIRDNRYSSVYGAIKYFCEKLALREKEYSMFDDTKIEEMLAQGKKMGSTNVLSKIFGKIFD